MDFLIVATEALMMAYFGYTLSNCNNCLHARCISAFAMMQSENSFFDKSAIKPTKRLQVKWLSSHLRKSARAYLGKVLAHGHELRLASVLQRALLILTPALEPFCADCYFLRIMHKGAKLSIPGAALPRPV